MQQVLLRLLTGILTEKLLISLIVHVAEVLAKRSTNTLDDELVKALKKALGEGDG